MNEESKVSLSFLSFPEFSMASQMRASLLVLTHILLFSSRFHLIQVIRGII